MWYEGITSFCKESKTAKLIPTKLKPSEMPWSCRRLGHQGFSEQSQNAGEVLGTVLRPVWGLPHHQATIAWRGGMHSHHKCSVIWCLSAWSLHLHNVASDMQQGRHYHYSCDLVALWLHTYTSSSTDVQGHQTHSIVSMMPCWLSLRCAGQKRFKSSRTIWCSLTSLTNALNSQTRSLSCRKK